MAPGGRVISIEAGGDLEEGSADLLAVPVFEDRIWGPGAEWATNGLPASGAQLDADDFTGKAGQVTIVGGPVGGYGRVAFVGLGAEADAESLRRAAGWLAKKAGKVQSVATTLHQVEIDGAVASTVEGFALGSYRFVKYLTAEDETPARTLRLTGGADPEAVARSSAIVEAVIKTRDLINEPAGAKSPETISAAMLALADIEDVAVSVLDEEAIVAEGLGGLAGVGQGAANPPRLVDVRYSPEGAVGSLVLVGKGIVFDSGGLSIKPAAGMETMKTDMSGAAAVLAAIEAIAKLRLPLAVRAIAPLAENMPGGGATHPGDVLKTRNGKTIEVLNTDAEGRLVLADGLALAAEDEPDLIVDVATLTGASVVALGMKVGGLWSNDDDAADLVLAAAAAAGEELWRMPLFGEYKKLIESDIADMKNTGGRYGGAITAALILAEFVGDVPWVHLDIAGPARAEDAEHYITKGGAGFGVRTLIHLAEAMVTSAG